MRGGLDDALDKLARRDELRRRAKGEAPGTPPAVTELVEAIAAVVAHNPKLGVTVGVEGAGEPLLLHFYFADGQVQVNADNAIAQNPPGARHADIAVEVGDPIDEPFQRPASAPPATDPRHVSRDDQDRFGPSPFGYAENPGYGAAASYSEGAPYGGPSYADETAERRYGTFDTPPDPRAAGDDLGSRMRDLGMASSRDTAPPQYPPHPFAATPPPTVPPQASHASQQHTQPLHPHAQQQETRRIQPEHHRVPAEPSAAERIPPQQQAGRGMPTPLPQPIPLQVERPEETEMAARRLAALLRDDPSLLEQQHRAE